MKRLLWCLCLCSLCPTWIAGCGDDEGGGGVEDGGVSQADLEDVNNAIDQLETDLGDLNTNVDGLGDDLSELTDDVSNLTDDVEGRLDALENPEILSCSDSELCIPDGVLLATGGISGIIDLICEHEVDCCTETELNLKFGPGIQSKDDCVSLFTDMVENGFSPDFLDSYLTPSVVYQIIGVAQALNDPRVHVEIDEEGVQACIDSLDTECPEIVEPGPAPEPECFPGQEYEADPCSLNNLLNGLQEEGELCGDYSYGEGEDIPECEDGFYCSFEGYSSNQQGICAKLPEEGDGCQQDQDCDPYGDYYYSELATNLYCNLQNAQCEPLGKEGDPCTFINDDFTIVDESNLYPPSRSATSQDCMNGLTCDPTSNTCVANCSEGRFCSPGQDPFSTCGEDFLCNVTEQPELYDNWGLGTCHAPLEEGDTCTLGFECETGKCEDDCDVDTGLCACSPSKAPGEACSTPGSDADCSSNWCGTDEECAAPCNCDDGQNDGDCDANEEFTNPTPCGDGYYCDFGTYNEQTGWYSCEPLIANGTTCDSSTNNQQGSCDSGFCDPGTSQCAAKVATDAACPSGLDEQCRTTQYCNNNSICRTYLTAGMNCDLADTSGLQCAKGLVCVDAATDTCQALAKPGEACNDSNIAEPQCDTSDDYSVQCVDIDGGASGLELRCYSYLGGRADGVDCPFSMDPATQTYYDTYCASGWCRPNAVLSATASACAQPLEEGDDCDTADQTQDVCAEGLYCNHPQNETAGKCAAQHGPGGSCKPYFSGGDCRFGGSCIFTKDQYLCDSNSIDYQTEIFCGGN